MPTIIIRWAIRCHILGSKVILWVKRTNHDWWPGWTPNKSERWLLRSKKEAKKIVKYRRYYSAPQRLKVTLVKVRVHA